MCLEKNILFRARHIKSSYNGLADSFSRLQIAKFMQLAPGDMQIAKFMQRAPWKHADCQIYANGAQKRGQSPDRYPLTSAATELRPRESKLLQSSLQSSSIPTYSRAWR